MTLTLTTPEEFFLLSRKNETGAEQGQFVAYGLAGAIVSDLMLRGFIQPDAEKPKRLIITDPTARSGVACLDTALDLFVEKKMSGKSAQDFVNKIANRKTVLASIGESLVEKGILDEVPKSFLGIRWKHYPETDASPEQALTARLGAVMFAEATPTPEDCVLIALMQSTSLLERNFEKQQLKAHKDRIKALARAETELTSGAQKAIEAVRMAVIVAAVLPAAVVATS